MKTNRITLAIAGAIAIAAALTFTPVVRAQIANVSATFVDGDLYFYDYAKNEIFHLDGTNRKLVIPSGSSLAGAAGSSSAGGAITWTGGAGDGTGNAGGLFAGVGGVGGNATTSGTGGAGGAANLTAAAGGTTATGTGGAGGSVTLTAAAGGAASGAGTGGAGGTITLAPGQGGTTSGGTAGVAGLVKIGGTNPVPFAVNVVRSTIADTGTISDAQFRGQVLFQDASGGAVTMTTRTGAQMDAAFPALATGNALILRVASNHASNTSTIAGGANVTLVGSGAVTNLGGTFMLIRTGTGTYDLVRVG